MRVEVLYLEGCPNYLPAVCRLKTILRKEGLELEVFEIEVKDEVAAKKLNFFGSPTIRINGLDIEADMRDAKETGLACRRYAGGLPSEEMIRSAVKEARRV